MKILHVYRTYFPDPPGGLQEAIRQIAMATQSLGAEPTIFTLSPEPHPKELHIDGITVIRSRSWLELKSCNIGAWDAARTFRELAEQTDVIHYHFPWPYADFLKRFAPKDKASVMTYHADIIRKRLLGVAYQPFLSGMINAMDRIIATSDAYAQTSRVLTKPEVRDRVQVIPLGIEDQAQAPWDNTDILTKLGLSEDEPYFVFIGALRYYKGLQYLIEAASQVAAKVVIIGTGPQMDSFKQAARAQKNDRLIFAGGVSIEDKFALLKRSVALVLPSHQRAEAFGMVLVEASMFAKPMITCEIGTGTSFVNAHNQTGLVVPPESPEALSAAMNTLLANAPLRQQMGLNARQRFEERFTGAAVGRAHMALYESVLESALNP